MVHQGCAIWLTGLPAAGKTTLGRLLEQRLRRAGARVELLDGDVIRSRLSKGLTYSRQDRDENVRRIGFVCELLARNGVAAIAASVSPYRQTREEVRSQIENFIEVYVQCPRDVLIRRDPKGLYKRALAGEISNFTGISDPYEPPLDPEITIHSDLETEEESLEKIWLAMQQRGLTP